MRYATKHAVWTPFLTPEEVDEYRQHLSARKWLQGRMKHHEAEIVRLSQKANERRRAKVMEPAE